MRQLIITLVFLFMTTYIVSNAEVPKAFNPTVRSIILEVSRPDSVAIARMLADSVADLRASQKTFLDMAANVERVKALAGKQLTDASDIEVAQRIIENMLRHNNRDAVKAWKNIENGKFDKKCREGAETYHAELLKAASLCDTLLGIAETQGADALFTVSKPPTIVISERFANPLYHKIMPKSTIRPDLTTGWEWLRQESSQRVDESFPVKISYQSYNSHPEFRVKDRTEVGYCVYDKNGNLIAVETLEERAIPHLSAYSDQDNAWAYFYLKAYNENYRDIKSFPEDVNKYLRRKLGLEEISKDELAERERMTKQVVDNAAKGKAAEMRYGKKSRQAQNANARAAFGFLALLAASDEKNKTGDAWLEQVRTEYKDALANIYCVTRTSPTSFRVLYVDSDWNPSYCADIEYVTSGAYTAQRNVAIKEFTDEIFGDDRECTVRIYDADYSIVSDILLNYAKAPAVPVMGASDDKIYESVEVPPVFDGGEVAIMKFINDNLCYPQPAIENNVQGTVVVMFVVTKTGQVGEVKVARSKDPDLDKEAVRVVKSLPKFQPGKQNGRNVASWFTLPVTFKLPRR